MFHTVPGFERIGEENAFAVLARATELSAEGRQTMEELAAKEGLRH